MDSVRRLLSLSMGQPTALTSVKEEMLFNYIKLLAEWEFPFTGENFSSFEKHTLTRKESRAPIH
jgi:hypothetical protein